MEVNTTQSPEAEQLTLDFQRKLLVLLASIFLAVGLVYVAWTLARPELASFPFATAYLALTCAAALIAVNQTPRHRLLLGLLSTSIFGVFAYMAMQQAGLPNIWLWWLGLPIVSAAFSRLFLLSSVLGLAFFSLLLLMYYSGSTLQAGQLRASSVAAEEAYLLAVALSTLAQVVFVGFAARWIAQMRDELAKSRTLCESALASALAARSLFLARVSHEIRTPLNGMIGATEMLQASSTPDTQKPQLMAMQEHSARMLLALVNDILDISRLEARKVAPEVKPTAIRRVVFQTMELFSVQAFDKGIELTCSCGANVPPMVVTDENRVRQIVSNLVNNAIKFTPQGGVHVHTTWEEDGGGGKLSIEVSDTGAGIPASRMSSLFEAYEQADDSVARIYGGTGLGLNICQALAKLMGGHVEASSVVGEGSAFTMVIPAPPAAESDDAPSRRVGGNSRALVATDSPGMRRHMQSILGELGVGFTHVSEMPNVGAVTRARADLVFVDAPMLRSSADAKRKLDEFASSGVRVALLAPLGSDIMIGAAVGTTLLYKPVRRSNTRDFIIGAGVGAYVLPQTVGIHAAVSKQSHSPSEPTEAWMQVLVVDDNPVNQMVAQAMLANMNCGVVLALNGIEALAAIGRHRFDAVLLDLQMPEMDGLTAVRELRRREQAVGRDERLPVIAMTGNNETSDVAECLEAGMDRFLAKPFGLAQLRHALESVNSVNSQ